MTARKLIVSTVVIIIMATFSEQSGDARVAFLLGFAAARVIDIINTILDRC